MCYFFVEAGDRIVAICHRGGEYYVLVFEKNVLKHTCPTKCGNEKWLLVEKDRVYFVSREGETKNSATNLVRVDLRNFTETVVRFDVCTAD